MAKVAVPTEPEGAAAAIQAAGDRFCRVGHLLVDLSAVVAIDGRPEGKSALHLVGGQTIELTATAAAGVLRQLGIAAPKPKRLRAAKPKVPSAKAAPAAKGLLAAAAAWFSA